MRCLTLADLFYAAQQEAAGAIENPSEESFLEALDRLGYVGSEKGFVKRHYAAIYRAFAARVGALDFATGVWGRASGIEDERLWADIRKELHEARLRGALGSLGYLRDLDVVEGKVVVDTPQGKQRVYRVGKLLRQAGATSTLIRRFETRRVTLEWEITADPMEVACMSYGRAWTSCMAPGDRYEAGPISDVLAGSALILFSRPGADKPCGREVLRPSAVTHRGRPVIVRSGRTYGTAALLTNEEIATAIKQQTGLDLDVRVRELTDRDGPYYGVHDDYSRRQVPVSLSDMDELTEKLRKTWAKFVDLPEPSVGALEEAEDPAEGEAGDYAAAMEVARMTLNWWYEDHRIFREPMPVLPNEDAPPDNMFEADSDIPPEVLAQAWHDLVQTSPHRLVILTADDTVIDEATSASLLKDLDEDHWQNFPDLIGKVNRLLDSDERVLWQEATLPDWATAEAFSADILQPDDRVYYWEVIRIG